VSKYHITVKPGKLGAYDSQAASMVIHAGYGGYAIVLYSHGNYPRARERWACHVYGSNTKRLFTFRGPRARGVVRSFFEGRPVNVL
jgi:hypothetical protein